MPPKKKITKKKSRFSEEEDIRIDQIDVQYNPDIVANLISELAAHLDAKCSQIQHDSDFMAASFEQDFHLELIKLPTAVKKMSIKRFKEEFGFSTEAFTKGAMGGSQSYLKSNVRTNQSIGGARMNQAKVMQTPSHSRSGALRQPREGEVLLSENGSPLGEFCTVKKASRPFDSENLVPPTPGVFVPLKSGVVLDLDTADIENLAPEDRQETMDKIQETMRNMQAMMDKLKNQTKV